MHHPDREKGGMDPFEAWLAQMPVHGVRQRIAQIEQELAFLRQLERASERTPSPVDPLRPSPSLPVSQTVVPDTLPPGGRRRRLSPERKAIIDAIRQNPGGMAPAEVARHLGRTDANPIQTNMSRMVRAGLLVRVEQGRYRLPSYVPAASLLNGSAASDEGGERP